MCQEILYSLFIIYICPPPFLQKMREFCNKKSPLSCRRLGGYFFLPFLFNFCSCCSWCNLLRLIICMS